MSEYDYTQACQATGECFCMGVGFPIRCAVQAHTCGTSCPDPLPNSQYVSDDCVVIPRCGTPPLCGCSCELEGGHSCKYKCDDGYEWDGEACVLVGQKKRLPIPISLFFHITKPAITVLEKVGSSASKLAMFLSAIVSYLHEIARRHGN